MSVPPTPVSVMRQVVPPDPAGHLPDEQVLVADAVSSPRTQNGPLRDGRGLGRVVGLGGRVARVLRADRDRVRGPQRRRRDDRCEQRRERAPVHAAPRQRLQRSAGRSAGDDPVAEVAARGILEDELVPAVRAGVSRLMTTWPS